VQSSEDAVVIGSSPSLELEDKFTLMGWINANMINVGSIISKSSFGQLDGYSLELIHSSTGHGVIRLALL
jgi:hypothetical protein